MENLQIILSLAATTLGLLISTLTFIYKFISAVKEKNAAKSINQISQVIIPLLEQAEKHTAPGIKKKEYVLTKLTNMPKNKISSLTLPRLTAK